MATVYLAEDLKHERKVALKVLKPDLAVVVGAERFLAEIKTTALAATTRSSIRRGRSIATPARSRVSRRHSGRSTASVTGSASRSTITRTPACASRTTT